MSIGSSGRQHQNFLQTGERELEKCYLKNLFLLLIFVVINGAFELVPKKYMESNSKEHFRRFPGVAAKLPAK